MSHSQAEQGYLTLPATAMRLGYSWGIAWRKLLTGQLEGKQVDGRWLITEDSVRREEGRRAVPLAAPAAPL